MNEVLRIGNRTITADELIPLLASYQMLPQLRRELIIDEAIASIDCTQEEINAAKQQFFAERQLKSEAELKVWMEYQGLSGNQLEAIMLRKLKVEKFKQVTWGKKLESYFFQSKSRLDKVIYSLLRTQDIGIAQELYFRIQDKEQTFAEVARQYSMGPEAQTGGLVGPVELSQLHPAMAQLLMNSQPGQVVPPNRIGEWFVIVQLEKFVPAQLDDGMKMRLLNELFETWMNEQQKQMMLPGNSVDDSSSLSKSA
ncbi:peptidylprolyl isomerase [Tolypothrix sp. FACHB-123]|uniref:peptidylprolyl isomerase n=1 Tax=Tolypothrix sp. FACHB-123 TaxID=2692868 RepID=UPI001685A09F|nr:peptidylprolyl isomerase [Tolypothrix sp. FACHB-123]MBD2354690.1 peptidylprolyl isomerase [Tolypothrix sp. FACHB-123]